MVEEKFDCIVVGAGPAGTAAAYTLAKAGLSVIQFERGEAPGTKNVMGGILYRNALEQIIPEFWKEAPLERPVTEQRVWLLDDDACIGGAYASDKLRTIPNAFTVFRANFDKWFAQKASDAGALLINETTVTSLIIRDAKVIGVKTDREDGEVLSDCVIIADGVNSLLARDAGFHKEIPPANVATAIKEVLFLTPEKIKERFNIGDDQGVAIELVGKFTKGLMGIGFLYTNKASISLGLGVIAEDLKRTRTEGYKLIDELKEHPQIKPLIQGAELKEYSAHLIPEGGYNAVPKLCGDGWLIAGDSAMLVNSIHREGSNLAMTSGRLAAETVIEAKKRNDFSAASLSAYDRNLRQSFVMKDLKKYRNAGHILDKNPQFFTTYPELLNFAAYEMIKVDGTPKKEKACKIIKEVLKRRCICGLLKDALSMFKAFIAG